MAVEPTPHQQETLAETFRRAGARMTRRELVSALVAGGLPGTVWLVLALGHPLGHLDLLRASLCTVVLAVAARVHIHLPFGFTVPTQLAYVPLVFALPPLLAPPIVLVGLTLAALADVVRGRLSLSRLPQLPGNAAFTLGPATVFVLAGVPARHAHVALLLGALAAEFGFDFGVSALRFAIAREARLSEQLADSWVYGVDAILSLGAIVVAQDMQRTPAAVLSLLPLLLLLAFFAQERRRRLESMLELGNAYRGTALVLGDVVEADDGYTGEHCKSVVALALAVGAQLDLPADRQRNLEFGALLHDVGKIAIPKEIINKPGELDAREWTIIKTHTVEGQRMLDRVGGFMREVGMIVRSHHERWDGQGYPDGLSGDAIPLESRIIACCDTWNAMRTDRSYRRALPYDAAMRELRSCSGTQLDPGVVRALASVVEAEEADSRVTLSAPETRRPFRAAPTLGAVDA